MNFTNATLVFEGIFLEAKDKRSNYREPSFRALGRGGAHGRLRLARRDKPHHQV